MSIAEQLRQEGMKEGIKEGIKEGLKEGRKENALEVARELLLLDMPDDQIIRVTKLSKEELEEIKRGLK